MSLWRVMGLHASESDGSSLSYKWANLRANLEAKRNVFLRLGFRPRPPILASTMYCPLRLYDRIVVTPLHGLSACPRARDASGLSKNYITHRGIVTATREKLFLQLG